MLAQPVKSVKSWELIDKGCLLTIVSAMIDRTIRTFTGSSRQWVHPVISAPVYRSALGSAARLAMPD